MFLMQQYRELTVEIVRCQHHPWVQQGGFAAVAGLTDGLAAPKVAQKGCYNPILCGKAAETCCTPKPSTLVFSILPP
jgi:hypothetical protein